MPETFKRELKYGLTCLTTTDDGLLQYLANVRQQIDHWLETGDIQRLVVVVKGVETMQTLERWQFNVAIDKTTTSGNSSTTAQNKTNVIADTPADENLIRDGNVGELTNKKQSLAMQPPTKSLKDIHKEIQAIIRQITASVTFLPLLQESCTFDLLVYTDKDICVPQKWADSDPCYVSSTHSSEVKLRSFTTSVHKIDSMVVYKQVEDWEL
jgi:mitotic spindle assembly checkpoint protein MAD2